VTSYELVFVDDRSTDASWPVLLEIAGRDPAVRLLRLSRNFGEEAAVAAGLAHSSGAWVVVMDCDLQDAPEDIPRLYAKALEGHDVVFTRRRGRGHSRFRGVMSGLYFRLVSRLLETDLDPSYGNFSMVSRTVAEQCLRIHDRDRHYRAVLAWLGFNHTAIDVDHAPRGAGRSTYGVRSLMRHAASGFFFQTSVLLRWIVYAGFVIALIGALMAGFFVLDYLVSNRTYPGWTSLSVLVLLMSGVVIGSLGVTALYVGRIFLQVKDRPLYVVDQDVRGREPAGPEVSEPRVEVS
jgi:dolichol-phosphate mannosyltransferase